MTPSSPKWYCEHPPGASMLPLIASLQSICVIHIPKYCYKKRKAMCEWWIWDFINLNLEVNHFRFIISTVKLRVKTLTKFVGFIDSNCCYWNIYMFKIFFFSNVYVKMLIRIDTADAAKSSWPDRSWNIIKNIYFCWCKIISP